MNTINKFTKNIVEFQNVSKSYSDKKEVLKNINFSLKFGEMAFIKGHSGSGKSTLLKLAAAIEKPTSGKIVIAGQNLDHLSSRGISSLRRSLSIVFQEVTLLKNHSVFANVAMPLVLAGINNKMIKTLTEEALEAVDLAHTKTRHPSSLSMSEKQRAGIARAIINRPPLLLADEPTSNLDQELKIKIIEIFANLNKAGTAILITTSDLDTANNVKYRVMNLQNGTL